MSDHKCEQCIPPAFADLGKSSKDLFNKGYNFGFLRLDTTTRPDSGIEFKTGSSHNVATGKFFGGVDVKYKVKDLGLTILEKWNTENVLTTELTIEDQGVKGSKIIFDTAFSPTIGKRTGKVRTEYSRDHVHVNTDITLEASPQITSSVVTGRSGFLAGALATWDTNRSKLASHTIALGYKKSNYALHTSVSDGSEFNASAYHKVNSKFEIGANLNWSRGGDQMPKFGVGGKYQIRDDLVVRGKISHQSLVGASVTTDIQPGLKLNLSALLNLATLNEGGGHKFGLGLEYEP